MMSYQREFSNESSIWYCFQVMRQSYDLSQPIDCVNWLPPRSGVVRSVKYRELEEEIEEVVDEGNKWFYIGYTGKLGRYLRQTKPKSKSAKETIEKRNLVKYYTYYTHLSGKTNENEYELIERFRRNPNCFNKRAGKTNIEGIVYLLVYTTAVVMPIYRISSPIMHQSIPNAP